MSPDRSEEESARLQAAAVVVQKWLDAIWTAPLEEEPPTFSPAHGP
jgi:hypothetical protein